MDFEKICMIFTMQEPYYGILLSAMDRVPDKRMPTMAVGKSGNVFQLHYNPDFVEKLDVNTTLEAIKHEILHVAFSHFTLWEDDHVSPEIHQLRNIALDMEVNGYINTDIMKGVQPVLAKDWGWDNFLGGREYFNRLYNMAQQQQSANAQQPQQPCNGGQGGDDEQEEESDSQSQAQQSSGQSNQPGNPQQNNPQDDAGDSGDTGEEGAPASINSSGGQNQEIPQDFLDQFPKFDDHSMWPDDAEQAETIKQIIDDMLVFAAEETEKACGRIPGEIRGRLEDIRKKKKPKPVADWKRYFRRYLGNEFSEFIRKSKKRESRRFPDAAGNRHRRKSHILVAIDTSGSVSMPEFREFFGQIKTLTATADFHVIECDARIQYEYDFKGKPNEMLHGGGGTDFTPVTQYYNEHRRQYDALVYFTDGYCDIPKDTPKDTLWVISSNGDQTDRKKYKVNGASVAFIPKKQ